MKSLYDERPQKIMNRLQQILKPIGYIIIYDQNNNARTIKKGCQSKPCPYFFKDKRGRIYIKFKTKEGDNCIKCIDKETDEWLAYYVYKEII